MLRSEGAIRHSDPTSCIRFLLGYFCINLRNSYLIKTHLPEILPVLICKWKIHHLLSAVYTSIYYPTLKSTSSQLSLSGCHFHSLTFWLFSATQHFGSPYFGPIEVLAHYNLDKLDSSEVWGILPFRNTQAIACIHSHPWHVFLPCRIVQNQGHLLCSLLSRSKHIPFWGTLIGKWWLI